MGTLFLTFLLHDRPPHKESIPTPRSVDTILKSEAKRLPPDKRRAIASTVMQLSEEYNLDPHLILAIMKVESSFNPKARSNKGAIGFMQILPIAFREVASDLKIKGSPEALLSHDQINIRVGAYYLSRLIHRFGGNIWKALMAYNWGPTYVASNYKGRHVPPDGYQRKVMMAYRKYKILL